MAYTELATDLQKTKWRNQYWDEYVRMSGIKPYMSASPNAIITVSRELIDGGKDLVIPLFGSLKGNGTGAGLLTGSEERLANYPMRVRPVWRRNAVVVKKSTLALSEIDVLNANKDSLKIWSADDMQERFWEAMSVVAFDDTRYNEDTGAQTGVPYAEATATQRNNWLTDNYNRALFGNSQGNTVAGNVASSLGNVDLTNDKWSAAMIVAAKNMARRRDRVNGRRSIRPYKNGEDGREYFVLFVDTDTFEVISQDPDIKAFNKDSREREVGANPYFQSGDLIWKGVIIREVPEMNNANLGAVGASSAVVTMGYLCGAQAAVVAWGQDPKSTRRMDDDYQFINGVGTEELRSIDKTFFKETGAAGPGTQHGAVTMFGAIA